MEFDSGLFITSLGVLILAASLLKFLCRRVGAPPVAGYLLLGVCLQLLPGGYFSTESVLPDVLSVLGSIGLVCLLFRIGLDSDLIGLIRQLKNAGFVWVFDVILSGGIAFLVAQTLLDLTFLNSLFIAAALSATSLGVSVSVWQDEGGLQTDTGELLVDVAELDDISAIILMAVLLVIAPLLHEVQGKELLYPILHTSSILFLKFFIFAALCYLFGAFLRHSVVTFFEKISTPLESMLLVSGIGFIVSGLAALFGFSTAIGAFFAGLVFSLEKEVKEIEGYFQPIYALFVPFFFINIALGIELLALADGAMLGSVLLIAAIFGKALGAGVPALRFVSFEGAALIGLSMIPRAEIALMVVESGKNLGAWAVTPASYNAIVFVSFTTCLLSPFFLRKYLTEHLKR